MKSGKSIIDLLQSEEQRACPHDKHITPIEPYEGSSEAYFHYKCEVCGYQWARRRADIGPEVSDRNTIL